MSIVTTFGELMLRLKTPGFQRFIQSTSLEATFGGGEANVSASLARLGHTVRWVSAVPEGPIGDWALTSLRGLGVDEKNLGEWLKAGVVAVGMGGALATGTLDEIEAASRRIMSALHTHRRSG